MAASHQPAKKTHKWTPVETRRLIRYRTENEKHFMKSKIGAKQQWEKFVNEMGLEGKVTGQQASKKWENLKQKYKELRTPKTGSGMDMGAETIATWQYYTDMHEVLGARRTMEPPVVVASFEPGAEETISTLMDIGEPSTSDSWTVDTAASISGPSSPASIPLEHSTPAASTTRRRYDPILEFLAEEAVKEQRRHEESEAKMQRFLDLFEKMVDKM